ncbi:protein of unknown function [Cupriavidus taiwanensis]|uniref:Uncharacterized protein n=1 Tax=Cupriavidus taiwanensis TaxID=164546 RepID=A0A7Z7J9N5_9BURK|nr:protein of unknown function [Cupriavidus taiwanensis]SOZ03963.1 hypothetical protein CBM2597_A50139 [Cupriavidus taiwanensis]SPC09807.1 hypothetical protein CBM2594_A41130 [Cupriavidus taiwanensis]SPD39592.1 protein of unknown function [Cupriavidus taiwanensis]
MPGYANAGHPSPTPQAESHRYARYAS